MPGIVLDRAEDRPYGPGNSDYIYDQWRDEMDDNLRYEIKAEAFRIMTGHMAPGKDPSPLSYPAPFEVRAEAWEKWHEQHAQCIAAMLTAMDRMEAHND